MGRGSGVNPPPGIDPGEQLSLVDERELDRIFDEQVVERIAAELESELGAVRVWPAPCGCTLPANAEPCPHGYTVTSTGAPEYDPARAPFPEGF